MQKNKRDTQEYDKRRYQKHKEKIKQRSQEYRKKFPDYQRNHHLIKTYGITLTDYNKLFFEQQGCCAICGKHQSEFKRQLDVDHNHQINKNRGLLCQYCNLVVGIIETFEHLPKLYQYLEFWKKRNE